MIYMYLLTWVGFGLIGYVPNTLYISDLCMFIRYLASINKYLKTLNLGWIIGVSVEINLFYFNDPLLWRC
jgi:hypothetical protein